MITLTPNAIKQVKEILSNEPSDSKLRVYVHGGGCTGFQYGFSIDTEVNEDDHSIEVEDITILVDSVSSQYLDGVEINYTSSLAGSNFSIKNPNATAQCGCGSSFAV